MPQRRKMQGCTPSIKVDPQDTSHQDAPRAPGAAVAVRLLVVTSSKTIAGRISRAAAAAAPGIIVAHETTIASARCAIDEQSPDVAIIASKLQDGEGLDLLTDLTSRRSACAPIMLSTQPTVQQTLDMMRAGALDLLSTDSTPAEIGGAITRALERSDVARRREHHIQRLRHICRRLNWSRREMSNHISGLCGDMINAFQDMADQVNQITVASEFNGLIRQELDVESLLRTALEYILAKCGSTNAAVFLPSGSIDFSLGAYVNYDCPKDALDMMLEHLAGIVAPRMAGCDELRTFPTEEELIDFLGDDAHWLADSGAVTFACRHEGECLAVVILFRDRRSPFQETALELLRIIAPVFAQQLARIVRVHHRHLPKDQWGAWGSMGMADDADDDIDLAA